MWLAIIIALIVVIISVFKWRSNYWQRRNVKTLPTSLLMGNIENPFTSKNAPFGQFKNFYEQVKAEDEDARYVGFYNMFQLPALMPMKLDLVKLIMTKEFQHFVDRGFYYNEKDDPLSAHLFALGGAKWRALRVKLTPTFTGGKMKEMFHTVAECGQLLESILKEKVEEKNAIDIKDVLACYSTDIICSCAFGLNVHTSTDPNSDFRNYAKKLFPTNIFQQFKILFMLNFPGWAEMFRLRVFDPEVTSFFSNVVQGTIKYRKENNYVRQDFLNLLLELQKKDLSITLNTIAAQSLLFFLAGFETSSTTMTFALYELARRQDLQDKVRAEINEVLQKHDGKVNYDSMNELKYMGQVIDETLRKWPALPMITRQTVDEFKFPDDDLVLKKGTKIIIPVVGIHYDEEYYPNPHEFDPDRFSPENKKNIPDYAHIPFGEGPRICIGMRFGIMQSKVGLTSVLKNYRVSLHNKTKLPITLDKRQFIPVIDGGLWLKLEKV